MSYDRAGDGALDYFPCRYGKSKLLFRGPRRKLDGDFVAVLGGTETYGRYIERPYPALVEAATGIKMVNFGCVNAGIDVFLNDPELLDACAKSRVTVIQVLGAQNMTNRYYAVHPRRNDRFLRASGLMKTIFREVDFTEFHFTRHMLQQLQMISSDKFEVVVEELKAAWVARMKSLLTRVQGKSVVLWLADHAPGTGGGLPRLDRDPLLVDRDMIEAVAVHATEYVEVVSTPEARAAGHEGMVLAPYDEPAAAEMPGPAVHAEAAMVLAPVLRRLM